MHVLSEAGQFDAPDGVARYVEQLRVPDLSLGTYSVPVAADDPQRPHTEDEVYVVVGGRGRFVAESGEADVGPGTVLFVPAGEAHRFTDVTEALTVLVIFGPAEGSRRTP